MNGMPRLEGMHAATASTIGWIEAGADSGAQCLFCDQPARHFQPLAATNGLEALKRLWWCRPCEATWVD
jgi:hypothetical protein